MTLSQIEAFRCVMLRGSMTLAAAELRTSQPSVSRLISELEADVKFQLFERKSSRLYPTEEGLALFREVELSFRGMVSLERTAEDIRTSSNLRLKISSIPSMAFGYVSEIIAEFRHSFPDTSISLEMNSTATIMQWLLYGTTDIGFVSSMLESPNVETFPLYNVAGLCALPLNHHLKDKKTITPNDLIGESFIALSAENGQRVQIEKAFLDAGIDDYFSLEARYGATICSLIKRGVGVGVVSPITARDYEKEPIIFRPFVPSIWFEGNLLLSQHKRKSLLIDKFIEIAKQKSILDDF